MIEGIGVGWREDVPDGCWLAYGRGPNLGLNVVGAGDVETFELPAGAVKIDLSKRDYEALRDRIVAEYR